MVATTGGRLTWTESKLMDGFERKAFIYARDILQGCKVDWVTGAVTRPSLIE